MGGSEHALDLFNFNGVGVAVLTVDRTCGKDDIVAALQVKRYLAAFIPARHICVSVFSLALAGPMVQIILVLRIFNILRDQSVMLKSERYYSRSNKSCQTLMLCVKVVCEGGYDLGLCLFIFLVKEIEPL